MLNPFVPFHPSMIDGLRQIKRRYLVSQRNTQVSLDTSGRTALLLTDYEDIGQARVHFSALQDPYKAILDLENPHHRIKLLHLMGEESSFQLFAAFITKQTEVEQRLNKRYSKKIRHFVMVRTNWTVGADKTIRPKLELNFGELFVTLKYSGQTVRIKLAELERY